MSLLSNRTARAAVVQQGSAINEQAKLLREHVVPVINGLVKKTRDDDTRFELLNGTVETLVRQVSGDISDRLESLLVVRRRGFWGRLNWLVTGR
jgi:hypothetical protein